MGKKSKRERRKKKHNVEEERRSEPALVAIERRARIMRAFLIALPILTIAAAAGAYFALDDKRMAALVGVIGVALWVPALLGSIGSSVRPRDRTRAGSIDFGNRR